jgi:hypothetical protein
MEECSAFVQLVNGKKWLPCNISGSILGLNQFVEGRVGERPYVRGQSFESNGDHKDVNGAEANQEALGGVLLPASYTSTVAIFTFKSKPEGISALRAGCC